MKYKRACVFLPAGPASLSSNHKAELSPVLAVGGALGQEPCKQMPAAGDHVSYLKKLRIDQSTHPLLQSNCAGSTPNTFEGICDM